jgi:hypothetical protein
MVYFSARTVASDINDRSQAWDSFAIEEKSGKVDGCGERNARDGRLLGGRAVGFFDKNSKGNE